METKKPGSDNVTDEMLLEVIENLSVALRISTAIIDDLSQLCMTLESPFGADGFSIPNEWQSENSDS